MRQICPELKGAAGLRWRLDHFLRKRQSSGPTPAISHVIALSEHVAGQHVVGQHGSWRHKDLVADNEFLIEHRLMNLMLIGIAEQRVVA